MKKCTAIIIYSALFFLFACNMDKKENTAQLSSIEEKFITIDTIRIHEQYTFAYDKENAPKLTIDITLPRFDLGNEQATARLDSTLAWGLFFSDAPTLKDACNQCVAAQKAFFNELQAEYLNLKESGIPPGMMGCYWDINGKTITGYNGYISYIMTCEEYYGGAHPNTVNTIVCFDPATGTEITLNDLFKENYEDTLTTMLTRKLMEDEGVSTIEGLGEKGYFIDIEMNITNNFILGNDSITFLYNRYEIAPYAKGDILITLDYETLKEIMK
jgi:hypothetical protein